VSPQPPPPAPPTPEELELEVAPPVPEELEVAPPVPVDVLVLVEVEVDVLVLDEELEVEPPLPEELVEVALVVARMSPSVPLHANEAEVAAQTKKVKAAACFIEVSLSAPRCGSKVLAAQRRSRNVF
jgi:hypothetical protein